MYNFLNIVIPGAACVLCLITLMRMDAANPMECANLLRNELRGSRGPINKKEAGD